MAGPIIDQQFRLLNAGGIFIDLSRVFMISTPPFKKRINLIPRYNQNGAVNSADRKGDSRPITMKFVNHANNDLEYRAVVNDLMYFFRAQFAPYYLIDLTNGIRAKIELETFSPSEGEGADGELYNRFGEGSLALQMIDALWETVAIRTFGASEMVDGDIIALSNEASEDAFPVFTITALDTILEFTIENVLTGAAFKISSTNFLPGSVFVIDSTNGSITLDGVESSLSLVEGGFFQLLKGTNQIRFNSPDGAIEMACEFRELYAY